MPPPRGDVPSLDRVEPVLVAAGLGKRYRSGDTAVTALAACDLTLHAGCILAIVGPSGSGKSTLLHLLAGIDSPTSGTVTVSGRDLASMTDSEAAAWRAGSVGFVLQRDNLIPSLTLQENVAAPLMLAGTARSAAMARALELLHRVGLARRVDAFPAEVSGGEAQRAAVARACVGEPLLVFADEPTGALDRATGAGVVELLVQVVRETNAATAIVTHDMQVAGAADRLVQIEDGRIGAPRAASVPQ